MSVTTVSNVAYPSSIDAIKLLYDISYESTRGASPLLLVLYGYTQTKSAITAEMHSRLVGHGFTVLVADIRGRGSSTGTADDGCREVQDLIDAIYYATGTYKSRIDSARTFVVGYSGGGLLAYRLAVTRPDKFGGIVSHFGINSLADFYGTTSAGTKTILENRIGGTPAAVPDNYSAREVSTAVQNIVSMLYMFHDTADTAVPIAHGDAVRDALIAASKTGYVYTRTTVGDSVRAIHGIPITGDPGEPNIQFETVSAPQWVTDILAGTYDSASILTSGTHRVCGHIKTALYDLLLGTWQNDVVSCEYSLAGVAKTFTIANTITQNEVSAKIVLHGLTPGASYSCGLDTVVVDHYGDLTYTATLAANETKTLTFERGSSMGQQVTCTKTVTVAFDDVTLTAGAANQTSSAVDLSTAHESIAAIKITNGSTGPTVAAQVQMQQSPDNSNWFDVGGPWVGGVTNSGVYSWSPVLDRGYKYVRFVAGSNTAQNVTLRVSVTTITKEDVANA